MFSYHCLETVTPAFSSIVSEWTAWSSNWCWFHNFGSYRGGIILCCRWRVTVLPLMYATSKYFTIGFIEGGKIGFNFANTSLTSSSGTNANANIFKNPFLILLASPFSYACCNPSCWMCRQRLWDGWEKLNLMITSGKVDHTELIIIARTKFEMTVSGLIRNSSIELLAL